MPANMQSQFIDAIFDNTLESFPPVRDPKGKPTKKRFDVYRNNIFHGLIEAVRDGFPMVERLVGEDFFREMARQYVRSHPPKSPLMFLYGDDFPNFVQDFEPAKSVPYLADFARFEYQRRLAYFANDVDYVSPEIVARLNEEELLKNTWKFHPSVQLIASSFPIFGIFSKLEGENVEPRGAEEVLTFRRDGVVTSQLAPHGMTKFYELLQEQNIGEALEILIQNEPSADLSQLVSIMVQFGVSHD